MPALHSVPAEAPSTPAPRRTRRSRWLPVLLAAAALVGSSAAALAQTNPDASVRTIHFSGYEWEVRPPGKGGPGPNQWNPNNVRVDAQGRLHLKLIYLDDAWQCAEVSTQRSFGFGRYQFQVTGMLDRLDPNVVLGLFNYPPPSIGRDGTNEIDIEHSRWGTPLALPASETIYPAQAGLKPISHSFAMPPGLADTTQRFLWQSGGIRFQSLRGHRDDNRNEYAHWNYLPALSRQRIPQHPMPVHINLWLVDGKAPRDGKDVEVIVSRFTFHSLAPAP